LAKGGHGFHTHHFSSQICPPEKHKLPNAMEDFFTSSFGRFSHTGQ
jgi:hypothetical protein